MTDPAPHTSTSFASAAAQKRLKTRRNADRRFRFYGQLAIGIALSALLLLAYAITAKAVPALSKHQIIFELPLDEASIAPNGPDDTEAISRNVSGFYSLVQKDLRQTFPEISNDRDSVRELYALVTRLAVLDMARSVAQNPSKIGTTARLSAALSDDLDLYLKGGITARQDRLVGKADQLTARDDGRFKLTKARGAFDPHTNGTRLIGLQGTWYRVEDAMPVALTLAYLAGEAPRTGDQNRADIRELALAETNATRAITDRQIAWLHILKQDGRIKNRFNTGLFVNSDSTYPELAGFAGALIGSLFTMLVTAIFAIPVGILAAIYLQEFAGRSRLTDLIELNINNLAAVPSIIFGLLGAAVFLNVFGMPRSAPFVGGLVLGLLVLPTVIIASRAALGSVPPSVRTAALGLGASKTQAVFHHVLPLATPGILTGCIIAMARALGETAPLLLIGMVAFVNEVPTGPDQESTVLPVLIYRWFSGAERAWEPLTAAAILILLSVLVITNLAAVLLRRRFERKW